MDLGLKKAPKRSPNLLKIPLTETGLPCAQRDADRKVCFALGEYIADAMPALALVFADGAAETYCTLSIDVPGAPRLSWPHFYARTMWAESADILNRLTEKRWIALDWDRTIPTARGPAPVGRLLVKAPRCIGTIS